MNVAEDWQYKRRCQRCNRTHDRGRCPAIKWRCFLCQKLGHAKQCCPQNKAAQVSAVQDETQASAVQGAQRVTEEEAPWERVNSDLFSLNNVSAGAVPTQKVLVGINDIPCYFEIDTGACRSVMSVFRFRKLLDVPLKPGNYKLNVVSALTVLRQ